MITLPGELDGPRVRVGCDVAAFAEVQDSLTAFGERYLRRVFTASEINDCHGRNRVHKLAARFAAKEAVIKAFAEPDPDIPYPWREIEVTRDGPLPKLRLSGGLAERAQHQGWLSWSLSLSHADCHAMAVVVVVCSAAESESETSCASSPPWSVGLNGVLDTVR